MGIDLKNEPHGDATWGDGSAPEKDWNIAAQQLGAHILEAHADWEGLVFVEGVAFSTDFRGYAQHPIDFGKPEWNARLVLSPHQYGPSVSHSALFKEPTFPTNLPPVWTEKWAFLKGLADRPVVVRACVFIFDMFMMGCICVGPSGPALHYYVCN